MSLQPLAIQDGLIANNSLQDLLGLERPSSTIKPTDNGDSRRLAGTCNKHMEAEITVNLQTVKGWTAHPVGETPGLFCIDSARNPNLAKPDAAARESESRKAV